MLTGAPLAGEWTQAGRWRIFGRSARPSPRPETPPIVMVHGIAVSSRYMIPTAELLAENFEVHAIDLPGFGESEKPRESLRLPELAEALRGWLDARGITRAVLVGNSHGCQVIIELLAHSPDRSAGVVLSAPTVDAAHRSVPGELARLLFDATRENPGIIPLNARDYFRSGLLRGMGTLRDAIADRPEDKIALIPAPILLVRGSRDPIVSEAWIETLHGLARGSEVARIEGAAHAVCYSAAPEFAAIVAEFARSLDTG